MTGEDGREMTDAEAAVCRALDRLGKLWPRNVDDDERLTLASMAGTLCVFRGDYMGKNANPMGANPDMVIWSSSAIPSTGGDW